jgi:hypothetical protein
LRCELLGMGQVQAEHSDTNVFRFDQSGALLR